MSTNIFMVFGNAECYSKWSNNEFNLPGTCTLPGNENIEKENARIPYHFVVGDAFTVSELCMKPFPPE